MNDKDIDPESMTEEERTAMVARLRAEAAADFEHADALEKWDRKRRMDRLGLRVLDKPSDGP